MEAIGDLDQGQRLRFKKELLASVNIENSSEHFSYKGEHTKEVLTERIEVSRILFALLF